MKGKHNWEDRENYGAPLARRPVVANGTPFFAMNEAVIQLRNQIDVVRPAVLIDPQFTAGATFR